MSSPSSGTVASQHLSHHPRTSHLARPSVHHPSPACAPPARRPLAPSPSPSPSPVTSSPVAHRHRPSPSSLIATCTHRLRLRLLSSLSSHHLRLACRPPSYPCFVVVVVLIVVVLFAAFQLAAAAATYFQQQSNSIQTLEFQVKHPLPDWTQRGALPALASLCLGDLAPAYVAWLVSRPSPSSTSPSTRAPTYPPRASHTWTRAYRTRLESPKPIILSSPTYQPIITRLLSLIAYHRSYIITYPILMGAPPVDPGPGPWTTRLSHGPARQPASC